MECWARNSGFNDQDWGYAGGVNSIEELLHWLRAIESALDRLQEARRWPPLSGPPGEPLVDSFGRHEAACRESVDEAMTHFFDHAALPETLDDGQRIWVRARLEHLLWPLRLFGCISEELRFPPYLPVADEKFDREWLWWAAFDAWVQCGRARWLSEMRATIDLPGDDFRSDSGAA